MAAGHVSRPIDDAALEEKFFYCARRAHHALTAEAAGALAAAIWSLDAAPDAARALSQISYVA